MTNTCNISIFTRFHFFQMKYFSLGDFVLVPTHSQYPFPYSWWPCQCLANHYTSTRQSRARRKASFTLANAGTTAQASVHQKNPICRQGLLLQGVGQWVRKDFWRGLFVVLGKQFPSLHLTNVGWRWEARKLCNHLVAMRKAKLPHRDRQGSMETDLKPWSTYIWKSYLWI